MKNGIWMASFRPSFPFRKEWLLTFAEDAEPSAGSGEELSELLHDGSLSQLRSSRGQAAGWEGGTHLKGRNDVKDLRPA